MHVQADSREVLPLVNVIESVWLGFAVFVELDVAAIADFKVLLTLLLLKLLVSKVELTVLYLLKRSHEVRLLCKQMDEDANNVTVF